MWSIVQKYASAFLLRSRLILEIKKARQAGYQLPISTWLILQKPHDYEMYIWLYRFLQPNQPITLVDIGGNTGNWSTLFRKFYPVTTIFAFEPVRKAYEGYLRKHKGHQNVHVFNKALSYKEGRADINVAKNLGLTSFYTYNTFHTNRNEELIRTENVHVDVLDNYTTQIITTVSQSGCLVIKIDVQGFELNVLKGSLSILSVVDAIVVECSFANQFENAQPTFAHLTALLVEFDLYPLVFGVYDRNKAAHGWERDVIFVKKTSTSKIWKA